MQKITHPNWADAAKWLARPALDLTEQRRSVAAMLADIRAEGDVAVRRMAERFDGAWPASPRVSDAEWVAAEGQLPPHLRAAIDQAWQNLRAFHAAQMPHAEQVETMPGVRCWRRPVAIGRVGLYVPGGTAPLISTTLMLGVPAQLAGCQQVVLCSPPDRAGRIHPAILYCAAKCGIREVFKIGGVQAIGAMAYGTATVPQADKIMGPGNAWVTAAKQLVSLDGVAIDLPAGPSEVAVLADAAANPAFVAADLLAQAEHGADSQVLLVTDSAALAEAVEREVTRQLARLPRRELAAQALAASKILVLADLAEGMAWANAYAPEHLILHLADAAEWAERVQHAGSVFIGGFTPESVGDYASGTNHVLPTGGGARAWSGVSLDSFFKKITYQQLTPEGLRAIGPTVVALAEAEGLEAHAEAVRLRMAERKEPTLQPDLLPFFLRKMARHAVQNMRPYTSARDEFKADSDPSRIFLDANENSLGGPWSRYPSSQSADLRQKIAEMRGIRADQVFVGNGSDEAIDLLIRAFVEPSVDNIVTVPPTYGMYAVQAHVQGAEVRSVPLRADFSLDVEGILAAADPRSKLLFLCSPNNPTGHVLPESDVRRLLTEFEGIVVVDEAYLDFAASDSWATQLSEYPNLVVLRTLSKAWGLAALRIGMCFASTPLIGLLNKIRYPYNLNALTVAAALEALAQPAATQAGVATLVAERERLADGLRRSARVREVFPSATNFLLVRVDDADATYDFLLKNGVVVRNRSREMHCQNCLRITVGSPEQNDRLLQLF
jgi:histidinol dehydrogenase